MHSVHRKIHIYSKRNNLETLQFNQKKKQNLKNPSIICLVMLSTQSIFMIKDVGLLLSRGPTCIDYNTFLCCFSFNFYKY